LTLAMSFALFCPGDVSAEEGFFPIGVWYEGNPSFAGYPSDPEGAERYYEETFADIASHGLNTVVVPNCPEELCEVLLRVAGRHGLRVILEVRSLVDLVTGEESPSDDEVEEVVSEVVGRLGSYRSLLRYQIRDEPPPDEMENWIKVQRAILRTDPAHPGFSCFNDPRSLDAARKEGVLSEAAFDVYPFTPRTPVGEFGYFLERLGKFEEASGGLPKWFVLQAHAYPGVLRYPTPSELRATTHIALAHGAKGIFYFLYQTMPEHPQRLQGLVGPDLEEGPLYPVVKELAEELGRLAPTLLGLEPCPPFAEVEEDCARFPSVRGGIEVGFFRDRKLRPYLVIANRDLEEEVAVRVVAEEKFDLLYDVLEGAELPLGDKVSIPPGGGRVLGLLRR